MSNRGASCLVAIVVMVWRWRWWPMIVWMIAVVWLHFLDRPDDGGMASAHGQHCGGDEKKSCCARGSSHPSFLHFRAVVVLDGMQVRAVALLQGIEQATPLALSQTPVRSRNNRKLPNLSPIFGEGRNPDGSSALDRRTMMRYALERESDRGSTFAILVELPK